MAVLGVDACRTGWAGIVLAGDGAMAGIFATGLTELFRLATAVEDVTVVGIDMPIGFPDSGRRAADVLARTFIGPRRNSVFMTPVRSAMEQDTHAAASAENLRLTGGGISQQAFALRPRIFEVEAWAQTQDVPVLEVHPEVSFALLAGRPLAHGKKTWAGATLRRELLARAGLTLPDDLGVLGAQAAVDDVLDAAAAAWSARRFAAGEARSFPDPPEVFSDGQPTAIWA